MNIKIIPCEKTHIEDAIELAYLSWQPIYDCYRETLGEKMFDILHKDWKEQKRQRIYIGLTSGRGYVALADGQLAGFIFYVIDDAKKVGTIEENAVNPKFRALGIAQKMYDFVFDKMRQEGMVCAMVSTGLDEAHAPTRRAYEKAGFDRSLTSVRYYREL